MGQIQEQLDEKDFYTFAILSDPSGIDQAELSMVDETSPDRCFRVWDFQYAWFNCRDQFQIEQGSRSLGKSLSIQLRCLAFPFIFPNGEMVVTAPEASHLQKVMQHVETLFYNNRLANEMLIKGRHKGVTRKPWAVKFDNGAEILGIIPQLNGVGIKGSHPIILELDEAQDYPELGYVELFETLNMSISGNQWRAHGVTKGVQDSFYKFTQSDSVFTVHHYPAMYRPTWTEHERQAKIKQYGSVDDVDFRRNIYGLPGDATAPLFIATHLFACVDDDFSSDYNTSEYLNLMINDAMWEDVGQQPAALIDIPGLHRKYKNFWMGMDVGTTNDPSVIVIFAEDKVGNRPTILKLIGKITIRRMSLADQRKIIEYLIDEYRPLAFSIDKTGLGVGLYSELQNSIRDNPELKYLFDRVKGYGFSEKIIVDFDDHVEFNEYDPEGYMEAAIKRLVPDAAIDILRKLVDSKTIKFPWDEPLLKEFQAAPKNIVRRGEVDAYGKTRNKKIEDHTLDACRVAVLAYDLRAIDLLLSQKKEVRYVPTIAVFDDYY